MQYTALLIFFLSCSFLHSGEQKVSVGAIRWDAWTGGRITKEVEKTLGPKKYHNRLPWFSKVIDNKTVKIDGSSKSIMDREIDYAADAGLNYWAFLIYQENSSMSVALNQYLKSKKRNNINFCLILYNTLSVSENDWPGERDRLVKLLKEPGYQKVLNNRPLVYAFRGDKFPYERYKDFLSAAHKSGLKPYSVYMTWMASNEYNKAKKVGFDAVSAYALSSNLPQFTQFSKEVERIFWHEVKSAKIPLVPLVSTGWDKNPRKDNPVSWEKGHAYHKQNTFPSRAKPEEIANHFKNSIKFIKANPKLCSAKTVIFYAWNEYDEGGWLAPTRGKAGKANNERLEAIKDVKR